MLQQSSESGLLCSLEVSVAAPRQEWTCRWCQNILAENARVMIAEQETEGAVRVRGTNRAGTLSRGRVSSVITRRL